MVELKVKRLFPTEDAQPQLPTRGTEDAACFDFYASRIEQKAPNLFIVHLDIAVEIPKGYVLSMQPRSSNTLKSAVMGNSPAQIDADYRGPIQIRYEMIPDGISEALAEWAVSSTAENFPFGKEFQYPVFPYNVGDRVVQGRLEVLVPTTVVEVEELSDTDRGSGGFGSTGK
jgi:dUTP pyrophosphatase